MHIDITTIMLKQLSMAINIENIFIQLAFDYNVFTPPSENCCMCMHSFGL